MPLFVIAEERNDDSAEDEENDDDVESLDQAPAVEQRDTENQPRSYWEGNWTPTPSNLSTSEKPTADMTLAIASTVLESVSVPLSEPTNGTKSRTSTPNDGTTVMDCNNNEDMLLSFALEREFQDCFRTARSLRHSQCRPTPYGIFGLYQHLELIRADTVWAYDAAHRHCSSTASLPYLSWTDWEHHRTRHRFVPYVTLVLLLASTIVFLLSLAQNGWHIAPWHINPMGGPPSDILLRWGALQRNRIVEYDEWYRLITALVLHAGAIHYMVNCVALALVAPTLERTHGSFRTALVFGVAGIGGNLASALFSPFGISMGTSGGILGWLGYCACDVWMHRQFLAMHSNNNANDGADDAYDPFPYRAAALWLILDLTLWIVVGLTPYVDNFAHVFGFLYGFVLAVPLQQRHTTTKTDLVLILFGGGGPPGNPATVTASSSASAARRRGGWAVGCAILVVGGLSGTVFRLHRSTSNLDVCKKCRYLSCVPFPFWTETKWWHCDGCEYSTAITAFRNGRMSLNVTCPYGDVVTVPYDPVDTTNDNESSLLHDFLPTACRRSCQL